MSGEGDPRFDVRVPPLRRPSHALSGLYAPARPAVIIPPPLRREPAPVRVSGGVLLPPAAVDLDDDGDLPTLPSQLDYEPEAAK